MDKAGNRKNYLDKKNGIFYASEIFKWFNEDFYGGGKEGILKFVAKYLPKADSDYIEEHEVEIEYLDYDWRLNSQE